jgi:DNA invertase Pin-like site-specific DNA recombinase
LPSRTWKGSAKHVEGRDCFQKPVADVGPGKVGIIMGYEVSRLARNNAYWYRLLELCALFDTRILLLALALVPQGRRLGRT